MLNRSALYVLYKWNDGIAFVARWLKSEIKKHLNKIVSTQPLVGL